MNHTIEIKNIGKNYGGFSLRNVSFSVPRGAVVGFIGENGAGKSTTIKAVLDTVRLDSGEITVFGKPHRTLTKADRDKIGVVLDEGCLPENLSVNELNIVLRGIFDTWDGENFLALAGKMALPTDRKLKTFSKGMRMRTAVAAALSHRADLLVLDEPTAGLDPVARDEIIETLYSYMTDDRSILISSHIIGDLEKLCDYIVMIHEGEIILSEAKDRLLENYGIARLADVGDDAAVVRVYRRAYGTDALVRRDRLSRPLRCDKAGLEDIMLFFIKGEKR